MIKTNKIIFFLNLFLCCIKVYAQKDTLSVSHKNAIKIDIFPMYYDFFDYRKQLRMGTEYERILNDRYSLSCDLDFGLFDDYKFVKYYDFFGQNGGMYSIEQAITIKGFHLTPAFNRILFRSKKKDSRNVFCSALADINVYRKKLDYFNSRTSEKYADDYSQTRLGLGIGIGARYGIGQHFFAEISTSFLGRIFYSISIKDVNIIKPLNAQWTDSRNNFWWVSHIKFGYAFK
jgi:hypothetical protein